MKQNFKLVDKEVAAREVVSTFSRCRRKYADFVWDAS